MEITTPTLDRGYTDPTTDRPMPSAGFENNLNRLQFESVMYDTRDPYKKPSFFSRFLSFFSHLASPMAFLAAPFTGGTSLIAAAALQGTGAMADSSIAKHNAQQAAAGGNQPPVISYPGIMSQSLASDPNLAVISSSRDASVNDAIHGNY
jgi:hypothetical protein